MKCHRSRTLTAVLTAAFSLSAASCGFAQTMSAPLDKGFIRSTSVMLNVSEMMGPRIVREPGEPVYGPGYPELWIAEVQFRPMRLLRVPVTDPATGVTARELVWYLVYRLIPRSYVELAGDEDAQAALKRRLEDEQRDPQNRIDEMAAPNIIVPRFVLQTNDEGAQHRYVDEVHPGIQAAIIRREFRSSVEQLRFVNAADRIAEVGPPVRFDDEDALEHAVYGVAIWRHVDPETDFFHIEITGISNAYRLTAAEDGSTVVSDKAVIQKFRRPGDRFVQHDGEFRLDGDPVWTYLPRPVTWDLTETLSVLRGRRPAAEVPAPR